VSNLTVAVSYCSTGSGSAEATVLHRRREAAWPEHPAERVDPAARANPEVIMQAVYAAARTNPGGDHAGCVRRDPGTAAGAWKSAYTACMITGQQRRPAYTPCMITA